MENYGTTGITSATGGVCASCGKSLDGNGSLEQFLGKLGMSDDMIDNLKSSMQNVDVDEYLNIAREYLKGGTTKATAYAKEHPGKVAAGAAVLAIGAGLLLGALKRE